jgi:hypothetical protein
MEKTEQANYRLTKAFDSGSVLTASEDELKSLLKDTSDVITKNPSVTERTKYRREILGSLIKLKQDERVVSAEVNKIRLAIVISVITFLLLAIKTGVEIWTSTRPEPPAQALQLKQLNKQNQAQPVE